MPRLGLGTYRAYGTDAVRAIHAAFELGYRLLDTSANYANEDDVGRAIASGAVPREEIFVTTKVEETDQRLRTVRLALEASLRRLCLEYVDLYLVHWPLHERTNDTWRAMEGLLRSGLTRSIGVSNFEVSDLEQLFATATVEPAVNQIKYNPAAQRRDLRGYCVDRGITVEAWAPIMRGHANELPVLARIGRAHGKTPEQVCLRWILQKGALAIPKSVHEARLQENANVYDFELGAAEMRAIDEVGGSRGNGVGRGS